MATKFIPCSIDGCNGNAHYSAKGARGWCSPHHKRQCKYGDPTAGSTPKGAPHLYIRDVALPWVSDSCLPWPYAKGGTSGHGMIWVNGRLQGAHRLVCEIINGPAPSSVHEAAHSCGKGHLGCVNPKHLSWKTPKENQADRLGHGTLLRGEQCVHAKLSAQQVIEIRSMYPGLSQDKIARIFNVSRGAIQDIVEGRTWKSVP